jgi:hypothetical protein
MDKLKTQLTAAILNSQKEAEIFGWMALTLPEYGTKPFNKRLETWLNKQAGDRFGTEVYKNWGMNGEDKTYPKVSFYLTKSSYSDKYELSVNYKGKQAQYDYDTKTTELRDRNENEKLLGLANIGDIVDSSNRIVTNRTENVVKMQSNIKELAKLTKERDDLKAKISAYNDKISYAISDEMRIK